LRADVERPRAGRLSRGLVGNYIRSPELRAPGTPDETLFACVEEARKDALEVAQEANAPSQARAEDATAVGFPSFSAMRIGGPAFMVVRRDPFMP
jgi:hypothetical protein